MLSKAQISPRIAALQQQIATGNIASLDTFWDTVITEGTPLIEPIEGDSQHALVTFLWRADDDVKHIVLYSELLKGAWWNSWSDALFTHLPDTNLYYRTYRVRTDLRFVYWLAPNHPLHHIADVADWDEYLAHCQPDLLNPHQYIEPDGRAWSFVEMPDAPSPPWTETDPKTPTGQVTLHQIHSNILQNDRNDRIYTPARCSQNHEPYALLVLFDGTIYADLLGLPTILDNLIAATRIKPTIAVLLDNPNRGKELFFDTCFVDFFIKELLPWIRSTYHVTAEPANVVIGGMSLGGLTAAFVALQHPEAFGNVLSQSGSFSYGQNGSDSYSPEINLEEEWLTRQYALRERLPLRFYLDVGVLENYRDQPQIPLLRANRHLRDVLQARGYPVHYTEFGGGHQYFNWRNTLPDALIALLGRS